MPIVDYFCRWNKLFWNLMKTIDPQSIPHPDLHQILVSAVAPRPIAFVSSIDEEGRPNLAPYSFFNVFSSNPPILIFSSNRKGTTNAIKDTLHNVEAVKEVVVNVVPYSIVWQMAVASIEYSKGEDEFVKSGLTPLTSDLVRPFRVKESPVQMECKVLQIMPLGDKGGAGNLVICEILRIHIDENVFDSNGKIDPHRIDLMGRMGRAFYARASGEAVYTIAQPFLPVGIGFDRLPESARNSNVLTGNELGQLAGRPEMPAAETLEALRQEKRIQDILSAKNPVERLHQEVRLELEKNQAERALSLVWLAEQTLN